jgi:hypothetical protein
MKTIDRDEFSYRLALVHEAEDRVAHAETVRASRHSRVGRFFANIGVSRAENILAHRNLAYGEVLLAPRATADPEEAPETAPKLELM